MIRTWAGVAGWAAAVALAGWAAVKAGLGRLRLPDDPRRYVTDRMSGGRL